MAVRLLHVRGDLHVLRTVVAPHSTRHTVLFHSAEEEFEDRLGTVVVVDADAHNTARLPIDEAVDNDLEVY